MGGRPRPAALSVEEDVAEAPARLPFGVRLVVAYDGTAFHGFQIQKNVRTVQGVLDEAVRELGNVSKVRGASRTDAGVHASGQVCAFDTDRELPPRGWVMQLNGRLPQDVSVRAAELCEPGFQPRFDAERKLYRYRVYCGLARDPLRARSAWFLGPGLARRDRTTRDDDVHSFLYVDAMEEAARALEGKHDFRAFKAESDDRENTIRTLYRVSIVPGFAGDRDGLAIEVEGDAFMKNMVRILAGTLLDIGRGKRAPKDIARMLGPQARRIDAGPTAPANGLTLVRMELGRMARLKAESAARNGVIAAASQAMQIRND